MPDLAIPDRRTPARRASGVLLLVVVAVLVGAVVARGAASARETTKAQARLSAELVAAAPAAGSTGWPDAASVPVAQDVGTGRALATLRVPRFGGDWSWVVVEGATERQLAFGPGRQTGSALPGARGAVVLVGHRSGHGSPFAGFTDLRPGDDVSLEQHGVRWTYRLVGGPRLVLADQSSASTAGADRELRLLTGWPSHASSRRLSVRGLLVGVDVAPSPSP